MNSVEVWPNVSIRRTAAALPRRLSATADVTAARIKLKKPSVEDAPITLV